MPTDQEMPHRHFIRLPGYDYSQSGFYFVTICTQDRKGILGEIVNGEMCLNKAGSIVQSIWNTLPERFPHVELDQYILMPNHLHGIIVLVGTSSIPPRRGVDTAKISGHAMDATRHGHANDMASQGDTINQEQDQSAPMLREVVRTFKAVATYRIRTMERPDFAWQRNYYEHIIRDDGDLDRIRQYIVNNPARWEEDRYYTTVR